MELSRITEESTETNTDTGTLNITGHTAVINGIEHLGNNPENWLLALQQLEQIENGPRKRKLLKNFFIQSGKILKSAMLSNNRAYAVLLGKEALFQGEVNAENARSAFEMALTICQKASVIYVMFAQFELNQGRSSKALKILKHGEVCVEDSKEILAARTRLEQGCAVIDELVTERDVTPLQNITNKQQSHKPNMSVLKSNVLANSPIESNDKMYKEKNCLLVHEPHPSPQAPSMFPERILNSKASEPVPPITPKHLNLNLDSQSKAVQTPPPLKITTMSKALHLGLDLQSPASPDLSFMSSKKSFFTRSSLTSDNISVCTTQSCHDLTNKPITTNAASDHSVTVSTQSEKKCSPVSRILKMSCQTTGKIPSRVQPKRVPRRVLIKDANTSRWSDSDSDSDAIKPIIKSPDEVEAKTTSKANYDPKGRQNSQCSSEHNKAEIDNNKENVLGKNSHSSAFHSFPHVDKQLNQPCRSEQYNHQFHNFSGPIEKSNFVHDSAHQLRVQENRPVEVGQHGASFRLQPHQEDSRSSFLQYNNHNPIPTALSQPHPPAQYNIHPAFRKFQEKKILEINGVAYILLKILGKGGSSKVYQVINPLTSEISAVKQVNLAGCESSVLEGYKNEIQFLKRLQGNRYIIKLIDYEVRENHLFLVMECGSLDLSGFLKKQKAENEELEMIDILVFWKNMLKAVETIHKHGVIHLDLKPANFMLVDYTLKLIDFGIANSIQVDATSIIKDTQFGTLNYMAPETINDMSGGVQTGSAYTPKFKVGPKADVWSLGCILYYIMYGKTPFQHIHHQAMKLFAITNENHKIDFPDFPRKELIEIVQVCLTRDPKIRPSVEMLLNHPLLK